MLAYFRSFIGVSVIKFNAFKRCYCFETGQMVWLPVTRMQRVNWPSIM